MRTDINMYLNKSHAEDAFRIIADHLMEHNATTKVTNACYNGY